MPHVLPLAPGALRAARGLVGRTALVGVTGLALLGAGAWAEDPAAPQAVPTLSSAAGASAPSALPVAPAAPPAAAPQPAEVVPVAPLATRLRPDVLVRTEAPLPPEAVAKLAALAPAGGVVTFRAGNLTVGTSTVRAVAVDPSRFRTFAASGTAESDAVWQSVARGEAVASHEGAKLLGLSLGQELQAVGGGAALPLRLGALATTGVPGADLVVSEQVGAALGLPESTAVLLHAGEGKDPVALAGKVEKAVKGAAVDLLTPPAANPVAFLTGSKAAKAFGAFSYRYFPDGTIAPDAAWVRQNIRTEVLPIMGRTTCHRLMLPQLRGALQDVVDANLGHTLTTNDGCYVPRFIERNPENSISLHTWGIAIDMDASTNYRGIAGDMHPEVVNIFKRWGFRWGGDWKYTDPMHFELAALLTTPKG